MNKLDWARLEAAYNREDDDESAGILTMEVIGSEELVDEWEMKVNEFATELARELKLRIEDY